MQEFDINNINFENTVDDDLKQGDRANIIHISIVMRRRKKSTVIQGLQECYDFKKILKYFKKAFSCNGNIGTDKKTEKAIIQLSGDHRESVKEFFYEEGIAEMENIRVHGI